MLSTSSNEGAGADKTITGTLNNPVMYCGAWDRRTDVMSSGDPDISVVGRTTSGAGKIIARRT